MKFNILFLKTNGGFAKKEKQRIRSTIKSVTNHAAKILDLRRGHLINFTVYPFDKNYIGGLAQAEDFIQISIPQRKKFNEEELKSIIYHEIHHIKKGYFGYAKKRVFLLEALLLEGLATVFALEQVPKYIPKWSKYGKNLIKEWLPQVKKDKFKVNYSHDEWFFGARGKPFQLGYKMGTYLVDQIKKNYPELTAEKLARKNVKTLLKLSKVNL